MRINKGDYVPDGFPAFSAKGQDGFVAVWEYDRPAVVLSAIGARCGKCFLATGRWTSLANTHLIFPDVTVANPKFLWYQLNDESSWIRSGSAQPFIKPSDIKTRKVKLPPLSEQERIVGILDEAEGLRQRRAEADRRTAELLPALFHHLFGDPATNPKGWRTEPLGNFCSPKQWPTISMKELTESGYPVYGANGKIGFYREYNHEDATVLVTCRGATCGTINVCEPKSYVTGNAMALDDPDPTRVTVEYLEHALKARGLRDTISGSAQPQIIRATLSKVQIPLPPLSLQREFAERVGEVRELERRQAESRRRLDALFAALLARAFSGDL